jgi:radical SAM superfamily enzyme with C-terminal helix-hairpin-helix motif
MKDYHRVAENIVNKLDMICEGEISMNDARWLNRNMSDAIIQAYRDGLERGAEIVEKHPQFEAYVIAKAMRMESK